MATVFGGKAMQFEHLALGIRRCRDHLAGDLHQPVGFRHLARTGVLASRRGADQQDAGRCCRILMPRLRRANGIARRDPVERKVILRIGKSSAGLARSRCLAPVVVSVPGHGGHSVELVAWRIEGRVAELAEKAGTEFGFAKPGIGRSKAGLRDFAGHGYKRPPQAFRSPEGHLTQRLTIWWRVAPAVCWSSNTKRVSWRTGSRVNG